MVNAHRKDANTSGAESYHLDSIFKAVLLPTKVHLRAWFPAVMYGCRDWSRRKDECQRLMPWTAGWRLEPGNAGDSPSVPGSSATEQSETQYCHLHEKSYRLKKIPDAEALMLVFKRDDGDADISWLQMDGKSTGSWWWLWCLRVLFIGLWRSEHDWAQLTELEFPSAYRQSRWKRPFIASIDKNAVYIHNGIGNQMGAACFAMYLGSFQNGKRKCISICYFLPRKPAASEETG